MLQRATQILLDAARMGPLIDEAKERSRAHESLYRGTSSEKLAAVAPYIFQFGWNSHFANWLMKKGWGHSWGVLLKSSYPLSELHKHFRKFLKVQTEAGQSLYFRFYDPRVLRIFLPTCDTAQLREFFGPIDYFIMEDEDPAIAIRYWHENGFLKTDRQPVAELIEALEEPSPLPQKAEQLPPETMAIIEELRKEYPDVEFPGDAAKSQPETAKETTPPHQEQKAVSPTSAPQPARQKPAFSPLEDNSTAMPDPVQKESAPVAESAPKPKTKWNMFD